MEGRVPRAHRFIPARAGNTSSAICSAAANPVHPRAGGEHLGRNEPALENYGSSPRGRGTPRPAPSGSAARRFIPARAGNTADPAIADTLPPVHPRAGGEHASYRALIFAMVGSSPRGRGTRTVRHVDRVVHRFIPARAGNTGFPTTLHRRESFHPRAGGEHAPQVWLLSPRYGSSPRGRGTRRGRAAAPPPHRFIPARAGNTRASAICVRSTSVHPRAGGEHGCGVSYATRTDGSSPRGRGTLRLGAIDGERVRFIPARAGNTSTPVFTSWGASVHPRAGGEHCWVAMSSKECAGSSPRGRGTPFGTGSADRGIRFIPARAGNTSALRCLSATPTVHPRAGGEHRAAVRRTCLTTGSSPRGRGTPGPTLRDRGCGRFIPARAGNTARRRVRECFMAVHPRAGGEHPVSRRSSGPAAGSSPRGRGTRPCLEWR